MNKGRIPKNNGLLENARSLRRDMTPQERKLWYLFLRNYPIKVFKQRIIESYIADFYCAPAKLVIEIDGGQHYEEENQAKDAVRTATFEKYGLKIVRYTNLEIDRQFSEVCESIDRLIRSRTKVAGEVTEFL